MRRTIYLGPGLGALTKSPIPSSDVVLWTRDLGYSYQPGRFAVRHLTLELHRGEVLGLLGRNGAGKTTTVRLLTTLLPPTEGSAMVAGYDLRTGGRALRAKLGVVLQAESLDFVSVESNLVLYAFLWGVPRSTAKARAEEMLELFELNHVRRRKPWALSGGERRRFQVARELMHEMEILFLDEPTVGLDAVARRRILRYLRERARGGLSIVFTTHILQEADTLCDRIAVLHLGRLLALDTPESLKRTHGGARDVFVRFRRTLDPARAAELERGLAERGAVGFDRDESVPEATVVSFRSERAEAILPWLAGWAAAHGIEIEEMALAEATLERAFLGMVGDEETGPAPDEPNPARVTPEVGP